VAPTVQNDLSRAPGRGQHTRWNFAVIVTEASAFMSGLAWVDPVAVLPLFITRLTGSTVLVGLVTVLTRLGYILPQLPMAAIVGHRPRRAPFLRWGVFFGRLPFLAFVAYLWFRGVSSPALVIWFMMIAYLSVALGNGAVAVPWQDIIAKSIPSRIRGRFFATMMFVTAVAAFGVGFVVRYMLGPQGPSFPRNYIILFSLMAVSITISTVGCALVREPIRPVLDRPESLRRLLASARPLLRRHAEFRSLVWTALLGTGLSFTMPFYIIYATTELGIPQQTAGIYIWASMIGGAVLSLVWGHVNDRRGPRAVIRGSAAFLTITPLLALGLPAAVGLAAGLWPGAQAALRYAFAAVFLVGGSTMGGFWMGTSNYLFELASDQERHRYIALFSTLTLPGAVLPFFVGWLLNFAAFEIVFAMIAVAATGTLLLSWRMSPPKLARHREEEASLDSQSLGQ
jgi:MFS family permease